MSIKKHLEMMGEPSTDRVTRFSGIVISITFDLYGCVQAGVMPHVDSDGKKRQGEWFDIARLITSSKTRTVQAPSYPVKPKKAVKTLGQTVMDKVTKFAGTVTSIHFELSGQIMVVVTPSTSNEGAKPDSEIFNIARLEVIDDARVMPLPNFKEGPFAEGKHGPAENPVEL